ncbi:hypothetical protein N9472_02310 [Methylophilaceae bacterium]|jgi:hypothetical protein|nr:hypothetical protein [Methylophilaceae bacterium]|tara:strand:- start:55 stop:342 length:288 start_codon:yes stop_codon:yes gene_type:complete
MQDIFNDMINQLVANPDNVVVIILVLSITIVFISILYVLFHAPESPNSNFKGKKLEKKSISKEKKSAKRKEVKYTKEFLKRVEGLDLELKEDSKQ